MIAKKKIDSYQQAQKPETNKKYFNYKKKRYYTWNYYSPNFLALKHICNNKELFLDIWSKNYKFIIVESKII